MKILVVLSLIGILVIPVFAQTPKSEKWYLTTEKPKSNPDENPKNIYEPTIRGERQEMPSFYTNDTPFRVKAYSFNSKHDIDTDSLKITQCRTDGFNRERCEYHSTETKLDIKVK